MARTTIYECVGLLLAFLGLGVAYFAIYLGTRNERLKRELEHKEYMKALEMGRSLPGDTPWLSPLRIGFLIATVVPIGIFGFAFWTSRGIGYQLDVWQGAGIVSVFAIACGSVVACLAFVKKSFSETHDPSLVDKTPAGEDAYDVVSSRG